MDISQWLQAIGVVRAVEDTSPCEMQDYENSTMKPPPKGQRAAAVLSCPRCKSNKTKFCYYNNYSISQPRYLCKTCKRYWTEGGHLRNVPVGGGPRKTKNKPSSSSSSTSSSSSKKVASNLSQPKNSPDQKPKTHIVGKTLYFDFNNPSVHDGTPEFEDIPFGINFENNLNPRSPNFCSTSFSHDIPDNSMISMPVYESGANSVLLSSSFDNHMDYDIKPSLSYSMDGLEHRYGNNMQGVQENATSPRIVFPFGELKPMSPSDHYQFESESNGCWINGMVYGGSW